MTTTPTRPRKVAAATTTPTPAPAAVKQQVSKNLRCDDDLWSAYGELCKRRDTTISQALRKHMREELARDARASATGRRTG